MNNRIVSALVLAGMIASSSAFASKSREMVMGRGGAGFAGSNYGSFFYDSEYNMFYNPAYVNDFKNWVNVEKGAAGQAEFGFVTSMSNFNLGLFFNRQASGLSVNDPTLTPAAPFTLGANALDLVIGGDAGVKWGFGATYNRDSTGAVKENNLDLRAGVSVNGLDPFVEFKVIGTEKNGSTDISAANRLNIGARYHFGEWVPYAMFRTAKREDKTTPDTEIKDAGFVVGVGRETKLAEGARLVYSLYYQTSKETTKAGTGVAEVERTSSLLPLNMAIEADVLSWLTLRSGVVHTIFSNSGAGRAATTARLGGTFHISKVDVDYAFGNGGIDSSDIGFGNSTFHQVALRYTW